MCWCLSVSFGKDDLCEFWFFFSYFLYEVNEVVLEVGCVVAVLFLSFGGAFFNGVSSMLLEAACLFEESLKLLSEADCCIGFSSGILSLVVEFVECLPPLFRLLLLVAMYFEVSVGP